MQNILFQWFYWHFLEKKEKNVQVFFIKIFLIRNKKQCE